MGPQVTVELDHATPSDEPTELFARGGLRLLRYRADLGPHPWTPRLETHRWGLLLVRAGAYGRRADAYEHVVDVNTGFFRRPGEEASTCNFSGWPEDLSIVDIDAQVVEAVPELTDATGPFHVAPTVDLGHRLLRRAIVGGAPDDEVEERLVGLVHGIAREHRPRASRTTRTTRRSTELARRRLVHDTCELLHERDAPLGLVELGRRVGSSPYHLSRTFRDVTGTTLSQYRVRLRVHAALDRITHGDEDLAAIAAAAGFADHSHMTRTVVAQLGHAPSELRRLLRPPGDDLDPCA